MTNPIIDGAGVVITPGGGTGGIDPGNGFGIEGAGVVITAWPEI